MVSSVVTASEVGAGTPLAADERPCRQERAWCAPADPEDANRARELLEHLAHLASDTHCTVYATELYRAAWVESVYIIKHGGGAALSSEAKARRPSLVATSSANTERSSSSVIYGHVWLMDGIVWQTSLVSRMPSALLVLANPEVDLFLLILSACYAP